MKKHTISLIACLLSSTTYSVELSDLNQELISNCKNKIEQFKLEVRKNNEANGIFDKTGCMITVKGKDCSEIETPKPTFGINEGYMGYSDNAYRCKVLLDSNGNYIIDETIWLVDIYGE